MDVTRRTVIGLVGVGGLAACGGAKDDGGPPSITGQTLVLAEDLPVGTAMLNRELKVIVSQPSAGVFKAFSAVCTHQGCTVTAPADGVAACPCHGSEFKTADGSVVKGPATKALPEYPVKLQGGAVVGA
ncbi:Rieske (2Fe-2S) protein [Actinocorallia lasiicapitis]